MINVKQLRLKAGMTQQELADHLGMSIRAVQSWEQGTVATPTKGPTYKMLKSLPIGIGSRRLPLTPEQIEAIRVDIRPQRVIAAEYDRCQATINRIRREKS